MSAANLTGMRIRYLLLGIVVFIVAWVILVDDRRVDLRRLEREEASLSERFEATISLEKNKETIKAQKKWLRETLSNLRESFPDSFRVALSEWAWHEDAWYYGVKIESLEFGPEKTSEFHAQRGFSLKARGSFRGIHNFLYDRFYASAPALRLIDIELKSEGADLPLSLVLTGNQFRYMEDEP
jgi:Tfp pilus assembly protein PilO